jgi:hypothetical protein
MVKLSLLGHRVKLIPPSLAWVWVSWEWTCLSLFGEVPCFLNIRSKQLGFLRCGLGLL